MKFLLLLQILALMINNLIISISNRDAHLIYCGFFVLSFIVQFISMWIICKKKSLDREMVKWMLAFAPVAYIGGLLICRILTIIVPFAVPCNSAAAFLPYLVLYGFVLAPRMKVDRFECYDMVVPVYLVTRATLILGCIFPGCCYGPSVPWGIYSHWTKTTVFPVRLVESMATFLLCVFLHILDSKKLYKKRGMKTVCAVIAFGVLGFFTDIVRVNEVKLIGMTSADGINAILTICAGLTLLYLIEREQQPVTTELH